MEMSELLEFIEWEHKRIENLYESRCEPKTKYHIFAKIVEEVGELSESLLADDELQRTKKLRDPKTKKKSCKGTYRCYFFLPDPGRAHGN